MRAGAALALSAGLHAGGLFALASGQAPAPPPLPPAGVSVELFEAPGAQARGAAPLQERVAAPMRPKVMARMSEEAAATTPDETVATARGEAAATTQDEKAATSSDEAAATTAEALRPAHAAPPEAEAARATRASGSPEGAAGRDTSAHERAPDTAPGARSAAGSNVGALDVAALHAALAEAARRCYPAAAKRYHLVGEAAVAFCLDGAGRLSSTTLARSSGQQLLDDAAKDCVVAGAMPLPVEAAGACYTVPVRFR